MTRPVSPLPTEKLYLSPRFYDAFCAEYGNIATYVARVHGRVLLEEKVLSDEVTELTIAGRSPPVLVNGMSIPRISKV